MIDKRREALGSKSIDELDSEQDQEHSKKVEAALFIAGKYLTLKELVALTEINPIILRRLLDNLIDKYQDAGIIILQKDDSWKMDVAPTHVHLVNKLATGSAEFSRAEQETLAIIAYKQPIKQSVIVKIRGNKAYDHIKNFVFLGLVQKRRFGHTAELSLTDTFYDYFHLQKMGDQKEHG